MPGGERDARHALNRTFNEGSQAPVEPVCHGLGQAEQNYPGSTSLHLVEAVLPVLRLDHAPTVLLRELPQPVPRVRVVVDDEPPFLGRTEAVHDGLEAVPANGFCMKPVAPSAAATPRNQPIPSMPRRSTCIPLRCMARCPSHDDVALSWAERSDACERTSLIGCW